MKIDNSINFMRAILISMMILVHIVYFGELYPDIKYGILSFMMPAFLLITGFLVNVNKTLGKFCSYILQIFIPYVIMVTGFSILSYFMPVNDGLTELSVSAVLEKIFITSIGPYWFLQTIMVCGIIYYVVFKLLSRMNVMTRLSITALLLMVVGRYTPVMTVNSAVFYFIGIIIRNYGSSISSVFRPSLFAIIPFAFIVLQPEWRDWGLTAVLGMVYFFLSFLAFSEKHLSCSWIRYIGMNTLPIYLFHPIFTMAAKYFKPLFAFDASGIIYAAMTVIIAIAGSLLIAYILDSTGLSKVFGKAKMLR